MHSTETKDNNISKVQAVEGTGSSQNPILNKETVDYMLSRIGRVASGLFIIGLFAYISRWFLLPVALGAVFAILFSPLFLKLESFKLPTVFVSGLVTIICAVMVLFPMVFLISYVAQTGLEQLKNLQNFLDTSGWAGSSSLLEYSPWLEKALLKLTKWLPYTMEELLTGVTDLARSLGSILGNFLGDLVARLPGFLLGLVIVVVSVYFFLVDGRRLVAFLRRSSMFTPRQTELLIVSSSGMCRSVIFATVVSALVQAILGSISCLIFGVPNVVLIGFLIFLSAFIPLLGSVPVTFSIAIYMLIIGEPFAAFLIFLIGAGLSVLDNMIRAFVMSETGNIHPLLAFLGAFGGMMVFGITGIFLGPIIAGLFVQSSRILAHEVDET